jgi:hypothetical protein
MLEVEAVPQSCRPYVQMGFSIKAEWNLRKRVEVVDVY